MGSDRLTKSHRRKETGANEEGSSRRPRFPTAGSKRKERQGVGSAFRRSGLRELGRQALQKSAVREA